jgi:hypothetical protein
MKWEGYVARMGDNRNSYRVLMGKSKGKRPLRYLDIGGRIIFKLILEK